jgi:hypothetical protein
MPRPSPKYYLSSDVHPEKEVTEAEFIRAEQNAGFRSKAGPGHVATGGFSGAGMHGRVVYVEAETSVPEPELDAGEQDQRRSDHIFYTRQLLARAAKVMEVEPASISWFDVVAWMEEHHGVKP